jgi:hypothetical protein
MIAHRTTGDYVLVAIVTAIAFIYWCVLARHK